MLMTLEVQHLRAVGSPHVEDMNRFIFYSFVHDCVGKMSVRVRSLGLFKLFNFQWVNDLNEITK